MLIIVSSLISANDNLIRGIESDNIGLVNSCIYMVGKYNIDKEEIKQSIVKQFRDKSEINKNLCLDVLYRIGAKEEIWDIILDIKIESRIRKRALMILSEMIKD